MQNAKDLAADPQLAARNFFTCLEHPKFGMRFSDRSALWPWDEGPKLWKPAPELGEANHYVFVDLLGHAESEFHAMLNNGILERE